MLSKRYAGFTKWIPSSDIDGIDTKGQFLANMSGARLINGKITNDFGYAEVALPGNLIYAITHLEFEILDSVQFTHSTQGTHIVYVLWGGEPYPSIRIYLDDTLLNLDESNAGLTFSGGKPSNINFCFVNDELKINLNTTVDYADTPISSVIFNLSLCYLPTIEYNDVITRESGWYIIPRWLGKIKPIEPFIGLTNREKEFYYQAQNVIPSSMTTSNVSRVSTTGRRGNYLRFSVNGSITIANVKTASKFTFWASPYPRPTTDAEVVEIPMKIVIRDGGEEVFTRNFIVSAANNKNSGLRNLGNLDVGFGDEDPVEGKTAGQYEININKIFSNATITLYNMSEDKQVDVDEVRLTGAEAEVVLVGRTYNGQRALLGSEIPVTSYANFYKFDSMLVVIYNKYIDWRFVAYEAYIKFNGIYYLAKEINVDSNFVDYTTYQLHTATEIELTSSTLNFNYGLPETARVDNQHNIYSEALYKNRIYTLSDDNKIRYTHIAGNALCQPDSFPYDEGQGFGYFLPSVNDSLISLAVSPLDELCILGANSLAIYTVVNSGGYIVRNLRQFTTKIGCSNRKGIIKGLSGETVGEGLVWYDANGVWIYGGGVNPPINLTVPEISNFWKGNVNNTGSIFGYYDPQYTRYIFFMNGMLVSFSIDDRSWTYRGDRSSLKGFVGYSDGRPLFWENDNLVKSSYNVYPAFSIETHWDKLPKESPLDKHNDGIEFDKILQQIHILFGDTTQDTGFELTCYADNFVFQYSLGTENKFHKLITPLAVRFKRVKFIITIPEGRKVEISELGFLYESDANEPLAKQTDYSNYGSTGYGQNYGTIS